MRDMMSFNCPDSKVYISPSLIIGLVIGLALLGLVIWMLVRFMLHYRRSRQAKSGPTFIV